MVEGDAKTELLKMNKQEKQFKWMEYWKGEWFGWKHDTCFWYHALIGQIALSI